MDLDDYKPNGDIIDHGRSRPRTQAEQEEYTRGLRETLANERQLGGALRWVNDVREVACESGVYSSFFTPNFCDGLAVGMRQSRPTRNNER